MDGSTSPNSADICHIVLIPYHVMPIAIISANHPEAITSADSPSDVERDSMSFRVSRMNWRIKLTAMKIKTANRNKNPEDTNHCMHVGRCINI